MILERFPGIYKVKCFANTVFSLTPENRTRPGHVLIAVVPLRQESNAGNLRPTVNSLLLKEIKDFVISRTSPFLKVEVINPAYEQIQIRCAVKFTKDVGVGHYISRLNQAVTDYLLPWNDIGYRVRFGWCVREYDLKSFIRSQDYVEFVTDYSMLRISDDGKGFFHLFDTVAEGVEEIHPKYPWSIAIPVRRHFIKTIGKPEVIDPEITGVDELEIGSTFIITGKESNGQER